MTSRLSSFIALIVASSFGVAELQGHHARRVKSEEMHIFRDRAVLFLRYEISDPQFTADLRERFDLDGSRELSSDERRTLLEYVQELAFGDIRLRWDDEVISPGITLKTTSGLDRDLPSAYPVILYWQLDFFFPDPVRSVHELSYADAESRWNTPLSCRIRLAPGVHEMRLNLSGQETDEAPARDYEFGGGRGSLRLMLWHRER